MDWCFSYRNNIRQNRVLVMECHGYFWGAPYWHFRLGLFFFLVNFFFKTQKSQEDWDNKNISNFFIFTVCGTHLMIVATWWLIFRSILFPINTVFITAVAWIISILIIYFIHRKHLGVNMNTKILIIRVPPAVLFFILYLKGFPDAYHTAYALAFFFCYLILIYKSLKEVTQKSFRTTLHLR